MKKHGEYQRTEEIREKNRQATIQYHKSHVNPFAGRKHTEKSKLKISLAKTGHRTTEETRKKLSGSLMGNKRRVGKKHTLETRKRMGKRGESHPNWKGGINPPGRNRVEYIEWRKSVFSKYGNKCALCEKFNVRLVAHHMRTVAKHPEKQYDPENGIVLCRTCHSGIHLIISLLENGVNSEKRLLVKQLIRLAE